MSVKQFLSRQPFYKFAELMSARLRSLALRHIFGVGSGIPFRMIFLRWQFTPRFAFVEGPFIKDVRTEGREGDSPKADIFMEVA